MEKTNKQNGSGSLGERNKKKEPKIIKIEGDNILGPEETPIFSDVDNNQQEKIKTINLNSGEIEIGENIIKNTTKNEQKEENKKIIDITKDGIVESVETTKKHPNKAKEKNPLTQEEKVFGSTPKEKKEYKPNLNKENLKNEKNPPLKTIRTFQEDIAKTLKESKTSLTKIVLTEKDKQRKKERSEEVKPTKNHKMIIGLIVVVVIAIMTTTTIYLFMAKDNPNTPKQITELKIPTIIFPNYQKEIYLTSLKRNKINASIENQKKEVSIPLGQIIQLYLTRKDTSEQYMVEKTDDFKLLLTSKVFFETLDSDIPKTLIRSFRPEMMFGFHSSLGNNPFLIIKVNSYETAFAGMLEWEKGILDDIFPIFKKEGSKIDLLNYKFEDIVISNKDVRAILNSEGDLEFGYSFADKNTLILVNNETTLQEIFRRLRISKLERSS